MVLDRDLYRIDIIDRTTRLFEAQFLIPHGMSHNSYVIKDESVAVVDAVSGRFADVWLDALAKHVSNKFPDYLILTHIEPDYAVSVARFAEQYPAAVIVASHKAFTILRAFCGDAFEERRRIVVEGDVLSLGRHELCFYSAPMVHWPEVMVAYDRTNGTLFSADAFGRFGDPDADEPSTDETARYYFALLAKGGLQVRALLDKLRPLPLTRICPLHGAILTDTIPDTLRLYDTWASYRPDRNGAAIVYASMYGYTKEVVRELSSMLTVRHVTHDLTSGDMTAAVADAFRHDTLVLACPTYAMDVFPPMRTFLQQLISRHFSARTVGLIENGSYAPMAVTVMRRLLERCHDLHILEDAVTIHGTPSALSYEKLRALAAELNEQHRSAP